MKLLIVEDVMRMPDPLRKGLTEEGHIFDFAPPMAPRDSHWQR
jgi:hypothetical protein